MQTSGLPDRVKQYQEEEKEHAKKIVQSWKEHCEKDISWGNFLNENRKDEGRPTSDKKPNLYTHLLHRLHYCDPMYWFRDAGENWFPEVAILAQVDLQKLIYQQFRDACSQLQQVQ